MLLTGSVVEDVAFFLVAGTTYPRSGKVFHPCDSSFVLPAHLKPKHSYYRLIVTGNIAA